MTPEGAGIPEGLPEERTPDAFWARQRPRLEAFEAALSDYLPPEAPEALREAMAYSLLGGGKRLRPALVFATLESLGTPHQKGFPLAAAIEMVHTYSLIHDDLPAMDDDDLRRGRPTNHRVFGEAMAILAGDGLQALAFGTLVRLAADGVPPGVVVRLVAELAEAAGPVGMVGGQALDLAYTGGGRRVDLAALEAMHRMKTGALIRFSVVGAAILAGAGEKTLAALSAYGRAIGLAFQVQDDILDVTGDAAALGKTPHRDEALGKATYPALVGLEESRRLRDRLIGEAAEALRTAGLERSELRALAEFIAARDR
ncbi:polyprenyl synthetase family protein [Hydrogenibacillus schlegelii]|uniref:Farnesyl diphosphate synthase n=1 Tax=Hydrogenibacillus schlegelii TaxID=1484 RepID=A0A132N8H9_HYDSH|nr:farnesyl diphosphate synthase [Hydrogenibacillus schlegelii]KWX06326.1 hypothetical protein TR75_06270 [Hydrogenibacillus schlegelii]MBT9283295.1 polyprenyl synthetase family protein [Hydrogenibacillus schlegelii]OAR03230.1 hypothetical protein SA87_04920 [Hydrogenibacillus schlegelii]